MDYETIRQQYQPNPIKVLLIAESPPPDANIQSGRHFYRSEKVRTDDRLFINTIRALYPETSEQSEQLLEATKEEWLQRFQADGFYMIEALERSLPHEVTKSERQELIKKSLSKLIRRVQKIASPDTKVILIKSNVFAIAADPLREAGLKVLNTKLVDYPGHYNQRAYREKLRQLLK